MLESQVYGNPTKKLSRDMYKEVESNLGKQLQQVLNNLLGRFDYSVYFLLLFINCPSLFEDRVGLRLNMEKDKSSYLKSPINCKQNEAI